MKLSEPAREIVNLCRRLRLDYDGLRRACQHARKHLKMKPTKGARKLPRLLTESELVQFFEAVSKGGNIQHELLFKLMLCTGLRVAEVAAVKVADVDVDGARIFVECGKGDKQRNVLFRDDLRFPMRAYIDSLRGEREYLFESSHRRPFSTGRIRQLVQHYRDAAGIGARIHPHLFRHIALSHLAKCGVSDASVQMISGHASRESLKLYQTLSLVDVEGAYQTAMKRMVV